MTTENAVEVGTKIIVRVVVTALVLWFLYLVREVVLLIFLSVLTAAALSPAIRRLGRYGLPRTAAVIVTYVALIGGLGVLLGFFIPIFFEELRLFVENSSVYAARLNDLLLNLEGALRPLGITFERQDVLQGFTTNVDQDFGTLFSGTVNFFHALISVVGFIFLAFYLSLEEKGIEKLFLLMAPERYHTYALSIAQRMQGKVSQWLFGQLLLMTLIFVIYYIGLSLFGLPYALALAVFGAIFEIIPYIGPVIAAVPGVAVAFLVSPVMGFTVLAFYIIVQQIEGNVLAPQIIKRSVGLSPAVLIIAVLIGAKLGGGLGILLTIAAVMMLSIFVEDFLEKQTLRNPNV